MIAFLTFTFIMLFFVDLKDTVSVVSSPDVWWMILLGVFRAGLSFFLYVIGLKRTSPTSASIVAMVEPVTASLFGFFILSQQLNVIQMSGMAIILLTVTVLSVKQN